jgi:hypothetical protein
MSGALLPLILNNRDRITTSARNESSGLKGFLRQLGAGKVAAALPPEYGTAIIKMCGKILG